jgi:hypothetical protein
MYTSNSPIRLLTWVKLIVGDLYVMPLSACVFHENWCIEGHDFLQRRKRNLLVLFTFFTDLGKIL